MLQEGSLNAETANAGFKHRRRQLAASGPNAAPKCAWAPQLPLLPLLADLSHGLASLERLASGPVGTWCGARALADSFRDACPSSSSFYSLVDRQNRASRPGRPQQQHRQRRPGRRRQPTAAGALRSQRCGPALASHGGPFSSQGAGVRHLPGGPAVGAGRSGAGRAGQLRAQASTCVGGQQGNRMCE